MLYELAQDGGPGSSAGTNGRCALRDTVCGLARWGRATGRHQREMRFGGLHCLCRFEVPAREGPWTKPALRPLAVTPSMRHSTLLATLRKVGRGDQGILHLRGHPRPCLHPRDQVVLRG